MTTERSRMIQNPRQNIVIVMLWSLLWAWNIKHNHKSRMVNENQMHSNAECLPFNYLIMMTIWWWSTFDDWTIRIAAQNTSWYDKLHVWRHELSENECEEYDEIRLIYHRILQNQNQMKNLKIMTTWQKMRKIRVLPRRGEVVMFLSCLTSKSRK